MKAFNKKNKQKHLAKLRHKRCILKIGDSYNYFRFYNDRTGKAICKSEYS